MYIYIYTMISQFRKSLPICKLMWTNIGSENPPLSTIDISCPWRNSGFSMCPRPFTRLRPPRSERTHLVEVGGREHVGRFGSQAITTWVRNKETIPNLTIFMGGINHQSTWVIDDIALKKHYCQPRINQPWAVDSLIWGSGAILGELSVSGGDPR